MREKLGAAERLTAQRKTINKLVASTRELIGDKRGIFAYRVGDGITTEKQRVVIERDERFIASKGKPLGDYTEIEVESGPIDTVSNVHLPFTRLAVHTKFITPKVTWVEGYYTLDGEEHITASTSSVTEEQVQLMQEKVSATNKTLRLNRYGRTAAEQERDKSLATTVRIEVGNAIERARGGSTFFEKDGYEEVDYDQNGSSFTLWKKPDGSCGIQIRNRDEYELDAIDMTTHTVPSHYFSLAPDAHPDQRIQYRLFLDRLDRNGRFDSDSDGKTTSADAANEDEIRRLYRAISVLRTLSTSN